MSIGIIDEKRISLRFCKTIKSVIRTFAYLCIALLDINHIKLSIDHLDVFEEPIEPR